MEMDQRNETINAFRAANKGAVLVVTDLAARGLDVPEVNYVVHFDYPSTHKIFVHRSGRTARKGEDGHTISLVNHTEVSYMIELCHYVGRKLLSESNPSDKEVAYYGTLRFGMLSSYDSYVSKTIKEDSELEKLRDTAEKAMQKFKKCRTPASSFSVKLSKELPIKVSYSHNTGPSKLRAC
jgi:ATP-dependent RNA helicase DDX54/DBP10